MSVINAEKSGKTRTKPLYRSIKDIYVQIRPSSPLDVNWKSDYKINYINK